MAVAPQLAGLAARHGAALLRADPLASRLFSSEQQRECIARLREELEALLLSGNSAGKTELGAALVIALMQGRRTLDGRTINEATAGVERFELELPKCCCPARGYLIVQAYKTAIDSSVRALEQALGDWPAHRVYATGEAGQYLSALYVKPIGCETDNLQDWSRLIVFVDKGAPPEGGRIDFAWADEPPSETVWREVRMRATAGQPFVQLLTLTPTKRERWHWLRQDFEGAHAGRALVSMSVYDNQALSPADIQRIEQKLAGDELRKARLFGEWTDTSGSCPWSLSILDNVWLPRCRPGRVERVEVEAERDSPDGRRRGRVSVEIETWEEQREGEEYLVIGDTALGIDDGAHDPLGAWVVSKRRPRGVARYNGYVGPWGLGWLMASLAERYGDALVDADNTGGYAGPVFSALAAYRSERHPHGYRRINRHVRVDKYGKTTTLLGFSMNSETKPRMIEAMRSGVADDAIEIYSREAVESLMQSVMDEDQELIKPPGVHYEDFVCLSRALLLIETPGTAPRPVPEAKKPTPRELFERASGIKLPVKNGNGVHPRTRH